jgi:hypothetical protein
MDSFRPSYRFHKSEATAWYYRVIAFIIFLAFGYWVYSAKGPQPSVDPQPLVDLQPFVDYNANQFTKEQCTAFLENDVHTLSATVRKQSEMHSFALMTPYPNEEGNDTKELQKYIASIEQHRDRRDFAVAITHLGNRATTKKNVRAFSKLLRLHGQRVFFLDGVDGANFIKSVGREPISQEKDLIDDTDDRFISPTKAAELLYELQSKADEYYEHRIREHELTFFSNSEIEEKEEDS